MELWEPWVRETVAVLGIAAATFAVMRGLFGFLAWLFPESDTLHRNRPNAIYDAVFDALSRGHRTIAGFPRSRE